MLVRRKRGWELSANRATPESVYRDRRRLLQAIGAGSLLALGMPFAARAASEAKGAAAGDPAASLYPFKRDPRFTLDRPITPEKLVTRYNNFFEFGPIKSIAFLAQRLPIRPWTIAIDGLVEKPFTIGIDDLIKKMPLEERLYRHRCVEAWSMAVPWSGFAMAAFVNFAKPLQAAKYVRFQSFLDRTVAPGQLAFWYPWPYIEGCTIEEAANELAFLATGLYGKPLPKQDGAPLRLVLPWKYGFKSIKSIVRFSFTTKRPHTFWSKLQPDEYGFWANVNPAVPHPRWSQAMERELGTDKKVPTLIYNGYGEYVAGLYAGIKGQQLFR
jgi:methionine sulfoxide reductase catalytic subunit